MYLTRFRLNTVRRGAQKLISSPHAMHAAVLAGFPGTTSERVLWRTDPAPNGKQLLIVSPARPDLTHLVEQAGWPTAETWETRAYDPLLDRVDTGQRYAFRLHANPTLSLPPAPGKSRGKRVAHVTPVQQGEWMQRQAAKHGFAVGSDAEPTFAVTQSETLRFRRAEKQVTLKVARFDGSLTVTDPALFRGALVAGIGPAKGYGCGLLTIAPVVSGD